MSASSRWTLLQLLSSRSNNSSTSSGKLFVVIRGRQSLTGSAVVELVRSLGNHQRPTRLRGHSKLRRYPEIERIDGLDAQPTWILRQIPSTGRRARQRGVSKRAHSSALSTRRVDFAA